MDTVTYPDPKLAELLAKFVLVKVDHDAEPELVKRHGVQPLPDVRLLAPDGKEIDHLVGFTSAARLGPRLQRALDVVAGKEPAATADARPEGEGQPSPGSGVDRDAVRLAVLRGDSFLRRESRRGFAGPARFLPDELVLFAWAASGLERTDSDVAALLTATLAAPPAGTYRAALRACALARLADPDLKPRVAECARFLESTQLANGQWSYGPAADGAMPELGDDSNSAYALLGLAACERAGVGVSDEVWKKAARRWIASQNEDGGFGYRVDRESASYASMTASGLHGLALARARGDESAARALERGGAWLRANFSVRENRGSSYREGRQLYGLYALERVGDEGPGTVPAARRGLPDDWYAQGAAHLIATQRGDGSWDDGADTPVPNTCFALLFLTEATRPVR
ncbi:MAG TPA: hypothetical protein VFG37_14635 [Planctomycetota bacterium]|nr:hypothetical protein [Planctomycetota bacterium]